MDNNSHTPLLAYSVEPVVLDEQIVQGEVNRTLFSKYKVKKLYIAALASWIGSMAQGTALGFSSPVIPKLENGTDISLTKEDLSWFASLLPIGALVSGFVGGTSAQIFGRKGTLLITSVCFLVGWLLITYASSVAMLMTGRFVTGFSCGLMSLCSPLYVIEISTPDVRGFLGTCIQVSLTIGDLITVAVGMIISWRWLAFFCTLFPTILLFLCLFLPESPRWLLAKKRSIDALEALKFLHHDTVTVQKELEVIEHNLRIRPRMNMTFRDLCQAAVVKPLFLSLALVLFQQFCGMTSIGFYSVSIFQSASTVIGGYQSAVIMSFVGVISTAIASLVMDRLGRKTLLISSGSLMSVTLCFLGIFFYFNTKIDSSFSQSYGWLPLTTLIFYTVAFSFGYGPIPALMASELLPFRARGLVDGFLTCFGWTCSFLVTKLFQNMIDLMQEYGVFWFYSIVCFCSCIFVKTVLPETKCRSLEDIEDTFDKYEPLTNCE
ncbi:facilitated trehalose transporter Tret1-like [Limulus polyphemus]|uniref:Facilitated trehalose transporter Tret1-like n=1 Tax=Limulus polyphemus TaxID=6850 RepID=A0ABM1B5E2_LIMPO|nr:facilitated trehalose transporter Tret1-like [Limulus polyphemus]